jgi:hypothetical protein
MSLRDDLTAKKRRRMSFPVEISDPTEARRRVETASRNLGLHTVMGKAEDREQFTKAVEEADAELAEHYRTIEFVSARPSEYEALAAVHFQDKDDKDIVVDDVLPALAAICAEDEELRDEAWWREYLNPDTTSWSIGERGDLYSRLIELNVARPDVRIPKG